MLSQAHKCSLSGGTEYPFFPTYGTSAKDKHGLLSTMRIVYTMQSLRNAKSQIVSWHPAKWSDDEHASLVLVATCLVPVAT